MAQEHATGSDLEFEALAPSIRAIAEILRACVGADVCLIAVEHSGGLTGQLYGTQEIASTRKSAASQATRALLDLPAKPVLFTGRPVRGAAIRRAAAALAHLAPVSSFVCLPLRLAALDARVCIASEQGCFTPVDLVHLTSVAKQVSTVMECISFGERLAMELARHKRRQISRDLHDSAIQPIIGLKLGLEALRRRLAEEPHLVTELDDLIALAGAGIGELRQYVGALRVASASGIADGPAAVRCQAKS